MTSFNIQSILLSFKNMFENVLRIKNSTDNIDKNNKGQFMCSPIII